MDGNFAYLLNDKENGSVKPPNKQETYTNTDPTLHRNDEQISVCLEPSEGLEVNLFTEIDFNLIMCVFFLKNIERKYLLCSCHLTITHIKKLIAKKIFENFDRYKDVSGLT